MVSSFHGAIYIGIYIHARAMSVYALAIVCVCTALTIDSVMHTQSLLFVFAHWHCVNALATVCVCSALSIDSAYTCTVLSQRIHMYCTVHTQALRCLYTVQCVHRSVVCVCNALFILSAVHTHVCRICMHCTFAPQSSYNIAL